MKRLIITMLLIPFYGTAQVIPANAFTILESYATGYGESSNYIMERSDGTIEVVGDSLTAIKMLFKELKKIVKERENAEIALNKSVQWSNTVSYYFKKNKQWTEYLKSIRKQGYKASIKKK